MKNINVILKFVFCLISMVLGVAVAKGQVYKLGDLYTFEDGTKGVVFYVNPDDPTTGTVAALNDLDGQFALWSGVKPQALAEIFTPFGGISFRSIAGWESHGRRSTQVLAESGVSPAANAIESEGWYIPDVMQLYKLYASVAYLSPAFESYGGDISSLCTRSHWSSTIWRDPSEKAYSIASNMRLESVSGMTAKYVRLVRDFPDTASVQAYWIDSRSSGDTVVSSSVTTSYGAVAVYRSDTLSLAAKVTVFWPASDTLYETVYASPQPYTSQVSDLFDGLDISLPGDYEYKDTLQTVHGCDSIVTLLLTVNNNVHYSDTLCSLKEDYYFAPFDTVFAAGTVSGVYEHHGTKTVDGVPVDTIAYYELTILPAYEQFDTTGWCLYESLETRRYEGDSRVTITVNGTSVTVTSETEEIVVEEVASGPGLAADFALRMQTVDGCDSVVFLHVDARRVERDTVRHVVSEHQVVDGRITVSGHTFEEISAAGVYELRDTLTAENGCDSIVTLLLTVNNNVHYSDTLCSLKEDYYFAPFDTVFAAGTVSGVYEHHGTKTVDGVPVDTIAYYELTILPAYEQFDTIVWCLYESSETRRYEGDSRVSITVNGTSVTVTSETEELVVEEVASGPGLAADFALRMQTVDGCDSVVFLHVDARRVERDTVHHVVSEHQVVDGRVTVSGHTFENITAAGVYELWDTQTAENGCDSIVTLLLTVNNNVHYSDTLCSLKEDYYFAPFDTVFAAGTVSGVYEHHGTKTVDGVPVDTIAYYELTILPAYEQFDTTGWCLYESLETRRYEGDSRVTITVNGTSVTVTSETEEIVVEEIASEPGSTADFALRMQTVDGCDSVVFLHVDARRVERDTVRHVVSEHQVVDGRVTVSGHTFEDITAAGVYELRDTLPAENGCDSIEVYELTVTPCVSDFSILCPPDVYDTLAYGDCVMTIYPERLGTPTVLYDGEWPFLISNDIPADYLFARGDNVVTWTATDPECGNSVTCEQHVVIAFPQCPDAVDYEGNVYHGVRIGCNCWTQRNLESTKYSDGAEIAGRYAYANLQYPDTSANVAVFGRLYSFEAAVRDSADNGHGHIQGICPDGWFLPTPEHYESLNEYGTPALRSPNLWIVGAGDNSTGFTALPAGFYNGQLDRYEGLLTETYFWSTKDVGSSVAKHIYAINYYCDAVVEQHPSSGLGFSVRCIKEK